MIVRESDDFFTMTKQHDHALFSGEVARYLVDDYFIDQSFKNDVLLAIQEHDRSWIRLDETPIWNDRHNTPFTFMDYPLYVKLSFYTMGLDEIEQMSHYAALLCSLHFTSFTPLQNSQDQACIDFINHERGRQRKLGSKLMIDVHAEMVVQHLRL